MFSRKSAVAPNLTATFTTNEVADISGLSLRQLQWWDERKLISPHEKNDHRRSYGPEEILAVLVVDKLRRKGLSLQKMKRLMRPLKRSVTECLRQIGSDSRLYLVTDGHSVYLEKRPERVLELFLDAERSLYLVCLSDQMERIASYNKPQEHSDRAARVPKPLSNHFGPIQLRLTETFTGSGR